ncbi:MAG: YgiQ family radical SAM protein, partial [Sphaerochaetaceae bacterium]|nr:YgiQ family radical SAM protein [Sphaerochaetaceae bacterium]
MGNGFLPMTAQDMKKRGWEQLDVLFISADAYVDHPSFAAALLGRLLEKNGYKVGIIAQPDWKDSSSIQVMGKPRLCVMVSGGNIDSMVCHYTSTKKKRSDDYYSPGGKSGFRPDRPTLVYCNMVRQAFGKIPLIIGGLEASLRRLAHYDYWQDLVKKSILLDSKADLLSYGMGEHQTLEIVKRLDEGQDISTF